MNTQPPRIGTGITALIAGAIAVLPANDAGAYNRPAPNHNNKPTPALIAALPCPAIDLVPQCLRRQTSDPPTANDVISLVVIGDSVPFNAPQDCPGCTGFADGYAAVIEAETGHPVEVVNHSRHDGARTADIEQQLASGELTELLRDADIVLISMGLNDGPPYDGSRPCAAGPLATDAELFAAVIATTTECIDEVTATAQASAANVLEFVRTEAPDAAIAVLTAYNAWTGWAALDAAGPDTVERVTTVITYALDQWRTALCAEAAAVDAVCVDVYGDFNGPDGQQLSGDLLADDYSHPSQLGNDRIRDLLVISAVYDTGNTPQWPVDPADPTTDWVDDIGLGCRRVPWPRIVACPE